MAECKAITGLAVKGLKVKVTAGNDTKKPANPISVFSPPLSFPCAVLPPFSSIFTHFLFSLLSLSFPLHCETFQIQLRGWRVQEAFYAEAGSLQQHLCDSLGPQYVSGDNKLLQISQNKEFLQTTQGRSHGRPSRSLGLPVECCSAFVYNSRNVMSLS